MLSWVWTLSSRMHKDAQKWARMQASNIRMQVQDGASIMQVFSKFASQDASWQPWRLLISNFELYFYKLLFSCFSWFQNFFLEDSNYSRTNFKDCHTFFFDLRKKKSKGQVWGKFGAKSLLKGQGFVNLPHARASWGLGQMEIWKGKFWANLPPKGRVDEGGLADPLGLGVRIPWVLEFGPFLTEMRPKGYLLFPIGKTNPHTPSEKFLWMFGSKKKSTLLAGFIKLSWTKLRVFTFLLSTLIGA